MRGLMIVLSGSLLGLIGCTGTGVLSSYNPSEDAKKLQGTWKLTGATYNGERLFEDVRLIIDGDQYIVELHGVQEKAQFHLGTGGRNTILVKHHENPLASQGFYGGSWTGIYELSGERLRICYDMTGRQYPKSFDASKGSRQAINEFAREKFR